MEQLNWWIWWLRRFTSSSGSSWKDNFAESRRSNQSLDVSEWCSQTKQMKRGRKTFFALIFPWQSPLQLRSLLVTGVTNGRKSHRPSLNSRHALPPLLPPISTSSWPPHRTRTLSPRPLTTSASAAVEAHKKLSAGNPSIGEGGEGGLLQCTYVSMGKRTNERTNEWAGDGRRETPRNGRWRQSSGRTKPINKSFFLANGCPWP